MSLEFRDVRFMSAAEKQATLRAWIRFLKSGLHFSQFTNGLYSHLIQHCSFIAHFNRVEFYSYYFESGDSVALFLSQFDSRGPCMSVEYGDHRWLVGDYADINEAMIREAAKMIPLLVENAHQQQKMKDVQAATALLAKHGLMREDRARGKNDARTCGEKAQIKSQDRRAAIALCSNKNL